MNELTAVEKVSNLYRNCLQEISFLKKELKIKRETMKDKYTYYGEYKRLSIGVESLEKEIEELEYVSTGISLAREELF